MYAAWFFRSSVWFSGVPVGFSEVPVGFSGLPVDFSGDIGWYCRGIGRLFTHRGGISPEPVMDSD